MAIEVKSHSNLSSHSPPFTLVNGGAYTATVVGLTAGGDTVQLHLLDTHGQPVALPQDVKWPPSQNGGSKMFTVPANTLMRWTVPQVIGVPAHNCSMNISSSN